MGFLFNSADGGSNGTTVTANTGGNSGGNSGNYWDTVNIAGTGATVTFSSAQSAHGGLSYALATTTNNSSFFIWRNSGGTTNSLTFPQTTMYAVSYFYFNGTPPTIGRIMQFTNSAISLIGGVGINASQKLTVVNSAGTTVNTSTTTLPSNAWFRVEMWCTSSNTAGQLIVKIYTTMDSVTATETITTASNINTRGGNIAAVVYGYPTTATTSLTMYLDGLGVSSDNWIGPIDASRTAFAMF